jgi:hypothetical protein
VTPITQANAIGRARSWTIREIPLLRAAESGRAAGDEPGDAGEGVEREHQRVPPHHLEDPAGVEAVRRLWGVAEAEVGLDHRGDHEDGGQQDQRDRNRAALSASRRRV